MATREQLQETMNYRKFKISFVMKPKGVCKICLQLLNWGDRVYNGGKNKVHVKCNDGKETMADMKGYAKDISDEQILAEN